MSITFMTLQSSGFSEVPQEVQELARAADRRGFCNYWYSPQYGLYADAPEGGIYDDRLIITWELLRNYPEQEDYMDDCEHGFAIGCPMGCN